MNEGDDVEGGFVRVREEGAPEAVAGKACHDRGYGYGACNPTLLTLLEVPAGGWSTKEGREAASFAFKYYSPEQFRFESSLRTLVLAGDDPGTLASLFVTLFYRRRRERWL